MGNQFPTIFLDNAQYKIVKQLKNSVFQSIFHNTTLTANAYKISKMLPGIYME